MKVLPSQVTCPWCEDHNLKARYTNYGVFIACSEPGEFNCPDTTGVCATLDEAMQYVKELCDNHNCWPVVS